ncbi:HD-GYP domain-containing protein [Alkalihalobacillus sp. MEB130]|uniref:HD-GYP domain-containing protein n=1 Tax=Alkalihalobacillus sp. MEB130 TaxID=2976704 RepID=UPI0028E01F03|nr:HD-GYP domain-containing protein [Alkalihalobacillus sp. MEB130]MDT8863027.1 HD-GYP domain-containing protein [Alkalihalobacillus sp. MEB130]
MRVKPNQLIKDCILASDVSGLTDFPIMKKNTVITENHIKLLNIFLINSVEVEPILANGENFKPQTVIEEPVEERATMERDSKDFFFQYLEAVKQYKKLFQGWQAGERVQMVGIRNLFIPLFEKITQEPDNLLKLHHYSTKEDYLYHHAVYVSILSVYLGYKLNYKRADWLQIGFSGLLADIGMAKIAPSILKKTGPLTSIDFEEIKKHPIYSYNMLKGVTGVTDSVLLAVLQHHERQDGSGYPLAANERKLHQFSKVIAVADVYHAMTSERYYRTKRSPFQVIEEIVKEQFGMYDLKVVQALVKSLVVVATGSKVRLSNGSEAEIVFFEQEMPTRPMVKLAGGDIVQLTKEPSLFIEDIIKS